MKKEAFNKTNIFKIEIVDKNPHNNIMDTNKNISKAILFKLKRPMKKIKMKLFLTLIMKEIKKMKKLLFQV